MSLSDCLETMMLCCFSLGWYWSIFAMLWTRQPYGKSAGFVLCTVCGYVLGLSAKVLTMWDGAPFSFALVLYSWNLAITLLDLWLFVHLSRRHRIKQRDPALVRIADGDAVPAG